MSSLRDGVMTLRLILAFLRILASCSRVVRRCMNLLRSPASPSPSRPRTGPLIAIADAEEIDILSQEHKLKPVCVVDDTLYFHETDCLAKELAAHGYVPEEVCLRSMLAYSAPSRQGEPTSSVS